MSALPLRLVQDDLTAAHCAECGEKTERIRRLIDIIEDFAEKQRISDETVRKYYNANQTLKAQLKRQEAQESSDALVSAVFEFWAAMCRTGNVKLGPKRIKKVKERLSDQPATTPAEFFRAIVGAAYEPFSKGDKLFNDLTVICKDESILDIYMQRYFDVSDVRKFIDETGGEKARAAGTALMDLHRQQVQETARKEAK